MVQTYRKFKQLLKFAKTRRLSKHRSRKTRNRKRGSPTKKQKGGNPISQMGESTVVAPLRDDFADLEEVPVVQSAQAYYKKIEDETSAD